MNQNLLAELASKARERDIDAFGRIYDMCVDSVYRYVFFRIGNRQDAEDITEEAFLRAFKSIGRYEQRDCPFTSWLFQIARMTIADHYRSGKRRPAGVTSDIGIMESLPDAAADKDMGAGHRAEDLAALISKLTPDQQNVIALRFLAGLSLSETAAMIGKKENAIKALQHRALEALRKIIEAER